jgi:hypothetical protein
MPLSRTEYLAANLTRPVPTKDRGVLGTVADARDYMLALPEDREFKHHLAAHSQILILAIAVAGALMTALAYTVTSLWD